MKQRQICLRLVCLCHRLIDVAAPASIWPRFRVAGASIGGLYNYGISATPSHYFPTKRSPPPSRQDRAVIKAHAVTKHTTGVSLRM